jgi:GNAT superfamily N-acetyltransferase
LKCAAAGTEPYLDIALDETRLAEAFGLSRETRWNQESDDWRLILREGTVFGRVRRRDGALVGSAAVLPLGASVSWIGMVLVTGAERRRGHARHLMGLALDHIATTGAVAGLDATPAGHGLYRSLGFEDAGMLMRMERTLPSPSLILRRPEGPSRRRGGVGGGGTAGGGVRRAGPDDLKQLCDYDAEAFGAERARVLHNLLNRSPGNAFLTESAGQITGFALARPGRLATQIGPLVADDEDTAERLLHAALAALSGPAIVDAFTHHRPMCALLASLGFTEQRPFTRMLNGPAPLPQDRTFLSAGPELG